MGDIMRQSRNKKNERRKKYIKELGVFLCVILLTVGICSIFVFDGFKDRANEESDELPEQSVLTSNTSSSDEQEESDSESIPENDEQEENDNITQTEDKQGNKKEVVQEQDKPVQNEQNKNGKKVVYLTFDDGPQNITMDILDLLDQYNAKATFFMLEPYMWSYPDAIEEMIKRGHSVGVHSVTHNKNKLYKSSKTVVNEMTMAKNSLEEITGVESNLMRVPYGSVPHMKPEYVQAVENHGFIMWDWNIDSMDWKYTDGYFVKHTINQLEAFDKDEPMIILMHDKETTVKHLEKLLSYLQDNNYEMLAIDESMEPVQFVN